MNLITAVLRKPKMLVARLLQPVLSKETAVVNYDQPLGNEIIYKNVTFNPKLELLETVIDRVDNSWMFSHVSEVNPYLFVAVFSKQNHEK